MRTPYDEKELIPCGEYFNIPGKNPSPEPLKRYSSPVTPRENFLMALNGEEPYWLPNYFDIETLMPACYPDAVARGFVMGGEAPEYMDDNKKGGKDAFGVEWQYVPIAGGSMEKPGQPLLEDLNDWKEFVKLPDVESWDWKGSIEKNAEIIKKKDHLREMWIFTGFFERIISFMEFENAAVAMIDEDQEDALHELLDACVEVYKKIAKHYKEDFDCDVLYVHDDWGSQKAPFFSNEACMEKIVPHIRELSDYCHSIGMKYEMHSCGCTQSMTDCYLAAGIDMWGPQQQNDVDYIIEKMQGKVIIGVWGESDSADSDEIAYEKGTKLADKYMKDYPNHPVYYCDLFDIHPKYREATYVESRKIAGGQK